jgi:hypothetical protein
MAIPAFNWAKALQEVSQIKVKSITDPIFKFALIALTIGAGGAKFVPLWVSVFIFSISGLLFLLAVYFYCYFAVKNPNYLRSETFQLHMKSIEYMGDKGNALPASTINQLTDITDPTPKELEDKEQTDGED